ncbi:cytochrome c [Streptosporangium jomthongense]|uniref:C-type cytochrome n=1 Tax=Marinobacter aromaticivorans TaxID=1494078 RepID=A0ABW2IXG2_9GAMM|nr:c-type cytochrome [Marinobacter aromaticivorans]GGE73322.1 cytochrome c [Streptosporangium jomthongense]
MRLKSQFITALTILLISITSAHGIEGDAKAGEQTASLCVACHQADGSGMNIPGGESWPRLAGLDARYLYKQLVDVQAGTRTSPTMMPFVNMLDEQQMKNVSLYYSQLEPTQAAGGEDATDRQLALGEKLATEGDWDRYIVPCSSCHGPGNLGAGEHFPAIAGQHAGYIAAQLRAWQSGKRDNDPQHLMLAIAERMNDEDINAVAKWLSLQPAKPAR